MSNVKKHSAAFIATFSFAAFLVLLPSISTFDHISNLDMLVEHMVPSFWSPALVLLFFAITEIGSISVLLPLSTILFLLLVLKKHTCESYLFGIAMSLGVILVLVLKEITRIPRLASGLAYESSFSFPSAHATMTAIFFLTLGYIFAHHIKNVTARTIFEVFCVSIIILVGFSRIYLSVHRPSEVFAGFLLGAFCVSISTLISHKLCNKNLHRAS